MLDKKYSKLLDKIQEVWESIHMFSWKTLDIWVSKKYLTEQDIYAERQLCNFIKSIDADAQFFAEEEHEVLIKNAENLYVIDPISSTFNFIHGLPHYSVCVAHILKWDVEFAGVYDPSMKELFYAQKWKWAFLNGKKLQVTNNEKDLSIVIWGYLIQENKMQSVKQAELFEKIYKMGVIRAIGSLALHYAYVACGRCECALSLPKDIFPEFAGKLLVEEAGWMFTDFQGGELSFDTRSIIASNKQVHTIIMNGLK